VSKIAFICVVGELGRRLAPIVIAWVGSPYRKNQKIGKTKKFHMLGFI
jgi:hypothetical protein